MAQVVEADFAEPGAGEQRLEDALREVVHLNRRAGLRWKDQILQRCWFSRR